MLQIDELQIRVPGINEEDGANLGRLVAEKVAAAIPDVFDDRRIPELNVQLKGSLSNNTTLMADRIADQIIRQIKLVTL